MAGLIAIVNASWAGPVAIFSFVVAMIGLWLTFRRDRHVEVKDAHTESSATMKVMIDGYVELIPTLQGELKRAREDREYISGRLTVVTTQYQKCEDHNDKLEKEMRRCHARIDRLEEELIVYRGSAPS